MNKTVWKYALSHGGLNGFEIPEYAAPLMVAMQEGHVCVWFCVTPELPRETRKFFISGTGQPVSNPCRHVGSCMDDPFVWHVWEIDESNNC